MLLQKGKDRCTYQQCHLGSNYVPNLQGRFLATENFFFTSKFFGLGPTPNLSDFESAGQQFCEEDWMKLKSKYQTLDEEDFPRVWFSNQVGNIQLNWALGAFIMKTKEQMDWAPSIVHGTLLGIFLLLSFLIFILWLILRLREPQVKTVYDLEKGHYIVTKVRR